MRYVYSDKFPYKTRYFKNIPPHAGGPKNRIPGNIKQLGPKSKYLDQHLRCSICDWCDATMGSAYLDTSAWSPEGESSIKWSGSIWNNESKENISAEIDLPKEGRNRVILDPITGQAFCNNCRKVANSTENEDKFLDGYGLLTDEEILAKVRCKAEKYYSHSYKDGDQTVKVYKPSHPKLRNLATDAEREAWATEYQASLSSLPKRGQR